MSTVGGACISRSDVRQGPYSVITPYTISKDGKITSVCFFAQNDGSNGIIALMIYRPNGGNWDYIGSSSDQIITGHAQITTSCNIDVLAGDHVGFYVDDHGMLDMTNSPYDYNYYLKDFRQTGTNINFPYTSTKHAASILVTMQVGDYYVKYQAGASNANDGESWTTAWRNFGYGLQNCPDGALLHIASNTGTEYTETGPLIGAANRRISMVVEDVDTTTKGKCQIKVT